MFGIRTEIYVALHVKQAGNLDCLFYELVICIHFRKSCTVTVSLQYAKTIRERATVKTPLGYHSIGKSTSQSKFSIVSQ